MSRYYVVSLAHTYHHEQHLTLWGPDNAGYHFSKERAGQYDAPKEGYHNSEGNIPIPVEQLDPFFKPVDYHGQPLHMIPVTDELLRLLGAKRSKKLRHLIRIKPYEPQTSNAGH